MDWINIVGTVATVLALLWAIFATVRARQDLLKESRRQFDLGLLADMWKVLCESGDVGALQGHVGALVRNRNDSPDLPLLRAYLGVKPDPVGQTLLQGFEGLKTSDQRLIDAIQTELDDAINRRVDTL